MAITDINFLLFFLPTALIIYYAAKTEVRRYVLLTVSLLFYAYGSFGHFLLLLISVGVNFIFGLLVDGCCKKIQGGVLCGGICYNLSVLFYYKYFDFITGNINRIFHTEFVQLNLVLPLGLSFFTFKAVSYLVDVYQKKIESVHSPVNLALYLSLFTQIQSGPLSRYNDMVNVWTQERVFNPEDFSEGVYRFVIGFNKKVLIANVLSGITLETFAPNAELSVSYAWLGAVCFSLQLFFDFAGYSDMAIGLSRMFGIGCPENFRYPYMSASVSEFWRRWHITLGAWFRDYVYIPLGGSRVKSKWRLYMNLAAVWCFTGLWHGASWNFVFWGLGYFVVIAVEKTIFLPQRLKKKSLRFAYRILVIAFVNFQWVLFRADGLRAGVRYLYSMFFSSANTLADFRALFLLKEHWVFIAGAIFLCFPVVPWLEQQCRKKEELGFIWNAGVFLINMGLFLVAVSYVVAGQNNPFLYANF